MKSVIRSSMLLGSRTNVGKVTLERSMPTLQIGASQREEKMVRVNNIAHIVFEGDKR